jgi:N-acetylglucosamine kinase-like BadF-type ATPase
MADSRLVMGVDGGGSKTVALLAGEQGQVIGRGLAGASNFQVEGIPAARSALQEAVREAFRSAGAPEQRLASLCLGMAGVSRPDDRQWLDEWLANGKMADRVEIVTDGALLLWAGTPDGWGIGVVSGTGSIAMGCTPEGKWARAGGWGPLLGDEGSAYAMGLAALHAITQAADGRGPQTGLTGLVLEAWELAEPAGLVGFIYQPGTSRLQIAGLGPLVSRAAAQGDAVALEIQAQACADLAKMTAAVAHQLGWPETGQAGLPCALGGGVLVHNQAVAQGLIEALGRESIILGPVEKVSEPARGAVRLALRAVRR